MPGLTGSCLCGAIRYAVSVPVTELRACHCKSCQKVSGAGGTVNAMLPSEAFKLTKGTLKRYTAIADSGRTLHRYFCADCGAHIYSQREQNPQFLSLRAGSFDEPPPMKIGMHIWTKSARPWSYIDPQAKQHPGQPDAPATRP
jgi:hypothetical protein